MRKLTWERTYLALQNFFQYYYYFEDLQICRERLQKDTSLYELWQTFLPAGTESSIREVYRAIYRMLYFLYQEIEPEQPDYFDFIGEEPMRGVPRLLMDFGYEPDISGEFSGPSAFVLWEVFVECLCQGVFPELTQEHPLIQDLIHEPKYVQGENTCKWYARVLENGEQLFAKVMRYQEKFLCAGINPIPVPFDRDRGMLAIAEW